MIKNLLFPLSLLVFLSSCNLYGGLSKPSDDKQHLDAARACFDQADYTCALENYNALSDAYNDTRISESSLVQLAQGNIFSMKDLIGALGNGTGSGMSFSFMANDLANRGVTSAATRSTIQQIYLNDNSIIDPQTKAFAQFIASVAMFNEVLATAIRGSSLSASDIVLSPSTCPNVADCTNPGAGAACGPPVGTNLTFGGTDTSNMESTTPVSATATIHKLLNAAIVATNDLQNLTGKSSSFSGIISSMQNFANISTQYPGATTAADQCSRQLMLKYLSL